MGDTAVMPCKHFQPDFFFVCVFFLLFPKNFCRGTVFLTIGENAAVAEKPSRLWWSYGFTLHNVFSLWKGETELGLLTAGNGGYGASSELVMMAAVHLMSVQAKKKKTKKKGKTDTGHVKHHRPRPLLCKSMLKNNILYVDLLVSTK